jgi:predicted dehydrogenase
MCGAGTLEGRSKGEDMQQKARIAVIGTGWWSTYTHIPGLQQHPDVELVAICDREAGKLDAAARAYGLQHTYDDYREMLGREKLDGVVIATNHASHYEITRTCLEHDLHVMLEKPMTLFARDARHLVEIAAARGRALIVGYPFNYTAQAARARDVLRSGRLGRAQLISCAYSTRVIDFLRGAETSPSPLFPVHGPGTVYSQPGLSGGGQGHLQVTHAGGLLFFVTGLHPVTVLARMRNHDLPVDLVDAMVVEFEGGALGTIASTGNGHLLKLDLQIHCEHGTVDLDMVAQTLGVHGPDGARETLGPEADAAGPEMRFAPLYTLVDTIMGRGDNRSPGDVGWRTVEMLDAAYRSAARGGEAVAIASLYDHE